jgi:hypothetical protein
MSDIKKCDCGTCVQCNTLYNIYEHNLESVILSEFAPDYEQLKQERDAYKKAHQKILEINKKRLNNEYTEGVSPLMAYQSRIALDHKQGVNNE